MALRLLLVLAAMAALAGTVQAGSIVDAFSWVGIYYGSAELLSTGGTLLSTHRRRHPTRSRRISPLNPRISRLQRTPDLSHMAARRTTYTRGTLT
jgi:hypothetical protein